GESRSDGGKDTARHSPSRTSSRRGPCDGCGAPGRPGGLVAAAGPLAVPVPSPARTMSSASRASAGAVLTWSPPRRDGPPLRALGVVPGRGNLLGSEFDSTARLRHLPRKTTAIRKWVIPGRMSLKILMGSVVIAFLVPRLFLMLRGRALEGADAVLGSRRHVRADSAERAWQVRPGVLCLSPLQSGIPEGHRRAPVRRGVRKARWQAGAA